MAGTVRGKIECFFAPKAYNGVTSVYQNMMQEVFTSIYNAFKVHPNMTEVARHGGVGSTTASINYWDEPNPFTNNAWFVFKMNTITENPLYYGPRSYPWYVLVQWNRDDQASFGSAPGNPGQCEANTNINSNNCRIGIQFAIGLGGDQNPWNGTGTLGQSVKGSPVWKTPTNGTGVIVFPRSNNVGGVHTTNKENTSHICFRDSGSATNPARCHIIMDDDNFVFLWDQYATDVWSACYFGLFVPRPSLPLDYPMVMLNTITSGLPVVAGQVYGSTSGQGYGGTSPCNGGGVPMRDPATNGVKGFFTQRYTQFFDSFFPYVYMNPNKYFETPMFDEYPIALAMYEMPNYYGYAGQIDWIRETCGEEARCRTTGTGNRLVVGGSNTAKDNVRLSVPWAQSVNPGIGLTREGIVF